PKCIPRNYSVVRAHDASVEPCAAPGQLDPLRFADDIAGRIGPVLSANLASSITSGVVPALEQQMTRLTAAQYQVHPSRLSALRRFLDDPKASFTSPLQAQALEVYLSRKVNMLVCLPTGHGKSLLFFLPAKMYESAKTTIVVVPLLALHHDFGRRADKHGIRYQQWTAQSTLESCFVPLVLVSSERVRTTAFLNFVKRLAALNLLLRIVFDEAHLMITQDEFRDCFNHMQSVRQVAVPIILLTATLSPIFESPLFAKLSLNDVVTFRLPSSRPEIAIILKPFDDMSHLMIAFAADVSGRINSLQAHERGLIFCKTVHEVRTVAEVLKLPVFHSSLELDVKQKLLNAFFAGTVKALVSTSVLGEGLDLPSIRWVVHYGLPRDPASYYQQSGRMCRDRQFGHSIVFHLRSEKLPVPEPDKHGVAIINRWANEDICRRIRPAEFLDGTPTQCAVLNNPNLCDVCTGQLNMTDLPSLDTFPDPIRILDDASGTNALEDVNPEPPHSPPMQDPVVHFSLSQNLSGADHLARQQSHEFRVDEVSHAAPPPSPSPSVISPRDSAAFPTNPSTSASRVSLSAHVDLALDKFFPRCYPTTCQHEACIVFVVYPANPEFTAVWPVARTYGCLLVGSSQDINKVCTDVGAGVGAGVGARKACFKSSWYRSCTVVFHVAGNIDKALDVLTDNCSKCFMRGIPHQHSSAPCRAGYGDENDHSWQSFKKIMRLPQGYCYKCFRPQSGKVFFGWHRFGSPAQCQYFDIIKPAVYVIWAHQPCRQEYEDNYDELLPKDLESYVAWLLEYTDGMLNYLWIFERFCKLRGVVSSVVSSSVSGLRTLSFGMHTTRPTLRTQTGRLDTHRLFTDAVCAAPLNDAYWISTPNAAWIPQVDLENVEVRPRRDGWYGSADPHRWPQLFDHKFTHLVVLTNPHEPYMSELPVSVRQPLQTQHYRATGTLDSAGAQQFVICDDRHAALLRNLDDLKLDMDIFIKQDAAAASHVRLDVLNIHAALKNYVLSAFDAVERMRSVPAVLPHLTWEHTEYQRYFAEASAYMTFSSKFTPRIVENKTHVIESSYMGAVSFDPAVVQRFYRAGLPVWYIRPYSHLVPELKIDDMVQLTMPDEHGVVMDDSDPPQHPLYSGPPGVAHLEATHCFGRFHYRRGLPDPPPYVPEPSPAVRRPLSPDAAASDTPTKKSKASHDVPVPTGVVHTPPKAEAGRDHFIDPDNALIPPPITQWSNALSHVQNDPTRVSKDCLPSGHYVPNPATFASAKSLARYLETWLTIRPAYLQYLRQTVYASELLPQSKAVWNALLVMTDDQRRAFASRIRPSGPADKRGKMSTTEKARFQAMEYFARFFPTDDFDTPRNLVWFQYTVRTPVRDPPPSLVRQVVWELYELSFRIELSAMDFKICGMVSKSAVLRTARKTRICKCFFDQQIVFDAYPRHNVGLASLHPYGLAVAVERLRRVLVDWPGATLLQGIVRPEDPPALILDIEHSIASFYCQKFYDICGRPAVVPHRLPAD
ncbi:hypothetical protein EVJ58_g7450, partial [Rhodofomes roseus]